MANPIDIFNDWYKKELEKTNSRIPSACCFSTIGIDGYPNSRFVSLKEIKEDAFIITGPINSRKGLDIESSSKVSITFWWPETEKQIRIQGDAKILSERDSENYFSKRNQDSKIVSTIFEQGKEIENFAELEKRFEKKKIELGSNNIPKPTKWAGYRVTPKRIELMEFMKTRLHKRALYIKEHGNWIKTHLQP